eukprot:TRINITY_DN43047_c0_g1_i1.p1 TRINITY_DN43047_c0_g1~~TRINITY_DN43047_c0_g1_i1.p1  ORF type:complete len:144 (+),score=50.13 TRINITY_DN43047_c0_g1_i1:76-507(+)
MAQQPVAVNPLSEERKQYYQLRMNKESQDLKDLQKKMSKMQAKNQQLQLQKNENDMVEHELGVMEEEAQVYKLVGPVLVSQEPDDAKAIVTKRLEYINNEIKMLDKEIARVNKEYEAKKVAINMVQEDFKAEVEKLLKSKASQ